MTVEHPPFEDLSSLVDDDYPADAAAAVERHVAACEVCRIEVARLRTLLDRIAALPRVVEPPASAWGAVRGRLRAAAPASRRGHWARQWGLLAAAGLVLVAGSSALTVLALRARGPTVAPSAVQSAPTPSLAVLAVERSYEDVLDELTATLHSQRASLAPATVETVERTLRIIDDAIAEARAALAADPRNAALVDILAATYEQKVQLLRRASELPART